VSEQLSCSQVSLAVHEPLIGSAPVAQCWIVIEQPGPWGSKALTDSYLDPHVGAALASQSAGTGTSILLARNPRRPGRELTERTVWVAHTAPGDCWLRQGTVTDVADILSWDFAALAAGQMPKFGSKVLTSPLFVCTQSGRDRCCAVHGRELYAQVMAEISGDDADRVWECSHLGGHRFAPTALLLPSGAMFGRLDSAAAVSLAKAALSPQVMSRCYRGRTAFPQPLQTAEAFVRTLIGETARDCLDALWVIDNRAVPVRPGVTMDNLAQLLAEVRHTDGRAWRVTVRSQPLPDRIESCGKDPVPGHFWSAIDVATAPPWR